MTPEAQQEYRALQGRMLQLTNQLAQNKKISDSVSGSSSGASSGTKSTSSGLQSGGSLGPEVGSLKEYRKN
jgi:hypothetical protein